MIGIDVEVSYEDSGRESVVAKLSADSWEINVRARDTEFLILRDIRTFDWNERRAVHVGRCAGADAAWCSDGTTATILVGGDDETWDVAVSVPVEVIDDLVRQTLSLGT